MLTLFYILVFAQIALGIYSLWDGVRWLRMVRARLSSHSGFYSPRAALICPCKGNEAGLQENLGALTRFDYANYEVFFVIASGMDRARAVIEAVIAESSRPAHLLIAGEPIGCSEKVNNLRYAAEHIGKEFDVLVFTDSDVRLGRRWLQQLVAPLIDSRLGASTTFRWLIPGVRHGSKGFASALASAWNAAIISMLGDAERNFCWGGGTAVRRTVFDSVDTLELWKHALSDDLTLTRALRAAQHPILFVPECLGPTLQSVTPAELLEFTNRQIIITRVYSPKLWLLGALTHASYAITILYALWTIFWRAAGSETWLQLAMLTLLIPLLAATKGALRATAVQELLPEWQSTLRQSSWVPTLLAPLVPFLYAWNSLVAVVTRRIRWRGIRYEMVSPFETRILSH